ncbi:MAG: sugar phosphate nucleotidyltransferase [Prevotellaceae bacterium]|nr:NTP transferase domain-containing protein [Prevotella sp.]MDD7257826.1 sugar phosphate nucleotidyltransferase [Prevotellaceae bacterium]MDY6131559.1 sugar phosphate nucleotidyltransferase [Prevotella sp.]
MTGQNKDNYCVILAGGRGRRLWPCSREKHPKQFMDFFSTGRTLLQATFDRMSRLIAPENIYVCTNQEYAGFVKEQLPELDKDNILSEPIYRNTAPSVAWATFRILGLNENARIVVIPSDQAVFKEDVFVANIQNGLELVAREDRVLTLGVVPTRPETGYGYIQVDGEVEEEYIYKVKSFTEKPSLEFARLFKDSGEFLWNAGIYVANAKHMRMRLKQVLPSVFWKKDEVGERISLEEEKIYVEKNFPSYPNLSVDFALLDNSNDDMYVMKCNFGWADLGMWHSIYESMKKSEEDNVVLGDKVVLEDCSRNIVKLPEGRLGIIHGLKDFIVAEEDNVLLICKKEESAAFIRKYINDVRIKYGDDFV